MSQLRRYQRPLTSLFASVLSSSQRYLRSNGSMNDLPERESNILERYANIYRPEVESELEYLAVQTQRNKSLQVNYEIE